ncbi:MAG: DNA translocase FtsK [bacterium]|nr:DNA translocase FtsK [bacterium]
MAKKNKKNQRKLREKTKRPPLFILPEETKKGIWGVVIFVLAVIVALSFFDLAGVAGKAVIHGLTFLIGKAVFVIPLIFGLGALVFFGTKYEKYLGPALLGILILIVGISGLIESLNPGTKLGGWVGYVFSWPFLKLFGSLVPSIIFGGAILVGGLIFWHLLKGPGTKEKKVFQPAEISPKEGERSLIKKIFAPKFKIKEVEPRIKESPAQKTAEPVLELKSKRVSLSAGEQYKLPPLDLLETDKGRARAGDTVTNSAIIKKTLENFGLPVEMSEINIGPTVTQYSLKPAEGIKLSKITTLSNNLSLALASHPIRIEAPIPGKSLVGIEVPNKERCQVRLRDLISASQFQNSSSNLVFALGKDVSGSQCYADLSRMPHLLVAGSTGTGKTIFLNSLILSLLYQNSPDILRFILIDPKRVEFSAYKDLPHLLTPVIFDAQKTVNALRWLVSEMERRFEILSGNGSRNISSYNEKVLKALKEDKSSFRPGADAWEGKEPLPFIILIIDELADLMAAKGREVEVGIVRLAQMARAVGIHLIVATQRPSVEVITGLIKANITSRVTFQVASQIDSRTVLDMAGAEKLLGQGDLLFISAEITKPKRIQGAYVAEKEVRKVIDWIRENNKSHKAEDKVLENHLAQDLEKALEGKEAEFTGFEGGEDPLFEEAKRTVVEAGKASASLLQRRLRVGYARAARLLDMLEEKGAIGPGEGAKPRDVYLAKEGSQPVGENPQQTEPGEDGEDWQKV